MVEFLSVSQHGVRRKKTGNSVHGTVAASAHGTNAVGGSKLLPRAPTTPRWHDELKRVEASRRAKSSTLMDSIRLNIQSYKDLLDDSILETNKAHRLVLGMSQVNELAANSRMEDPNYPSKMLQSLKEAEDVVQGSFRESSEQMGAMDGKLLRSIAELQDFKTRLEDEGSTIVGAMVQLEEHVVQSWDTYFESAQASSKRNRLGAKDQWLSELQYRECVAKQKSNMDASLKVLEELFAQISSYECRRRINLREYMILLSQSCTLVFQTADAAQTVAMRDWIEKETTAQDIQDQVAKLVQEKLEQIELDEETDDDELDAPEEVLSSDPLTIAMFYSNLFPATSLLQSEFLADACVVERITRGSLGGTSTCIALVVVTSDQFMHLFELKSDSGIALDDPPERALDHLLNNTQRTSGAFDKNFSLDPTRTIDLGQMEVSMGNEENSIDLISKPDASKPYAPLSLRTFSPREQAELINAIHGENMPAIF